MSNVLIGIIGVILFIGLALAGALFLGPRFQEATLNSKTAAMAQAMSQVANASEMYFTMTGRHITVDGSNALVTGGYLKEQIRNPVSGAPIVLNTFPGVTRDQASVYTYIGYGADAKKVCKEIERQGGAQDPEAAMATVSDWGARVVANRRFGCMRFEIDGPENYYAYQPV